MEDSRTKVHQEDTDHIRELRDKLEIHCKQNKVRDELIDDRDAKTEKKIDRLMPLVDLIPTLESIVEDQKAMTIVSKKILRIVGYISAVIGLLYLVFRFWKDIK